MLFDDVIQSPFTAARIVLPFSLYLATSLVKGVESVKYVPLLITSKERFGCCFGFASTILIILLAPHPAEPPLPKCTRVYTAPVSLPLSFMFVVSFESSPTNEKRVASASKIALCPKIPKTITIAKTIAIIFVK